MAEEKKDKKKSSGGPSDLLVFFIFMVILYFLWVWTGGPERSFQSRNDQFIRDDFTTYNEPLLGQPGSVTNTLPFLR